MSTSMALAVRLLAAAEMFVLLATFPTSTSVSAYAADPKFEVASVKPCHKIPPDGARVEGGRGRITLECLTLDDLVRGAYILYANGKPWPVDSNTRQASFPMPRGQMFQDIRGSAGWMKSELFTIDGKAESSAALETMRGPMMQGLLAERFQLRIHIEKRELKVYQLIAGKNGARLQPAKVGSCIALNPERPPSALGSGQGAKPVICGSLSRSSRGGLDIKGVTMRDLCITLSGAMDDDVIDATGIAGRYDLHLDLSFADFSHFRRPGPAQENGESSIATASDPGGTVIGSLHNLGLDLRPAKIIIDSPVIDHADRPTPN